VLERINESGDIYEAWDDEPWIVEGAAVRVSLVCFSAKEEAKNLPHWLDGEVVRSIYADLTANALEEGLDLTKAHPLSTNKGICFMGASKKGPFDISGDIARKWLIAPTNPNGLSNDLVIKPLYNAIDITRRPRDMWVVDFGTNITESEAALFELPYKYIFENVKPV
jgi:hypothetical protein